MSQTQGKPFTNLYTKTINQINSNAFNYNLSPQSNKHNLNNSSILPDHLSLSSNNYIIKSQEISPIRKEYSNQSPELLDINVCSNNLSGIDSDNDSSELEFKEENENEKEKQFNQDHLNQKVNFSTKKCLFPKKDISYSQSNCSMSQYYDTTSKYLSQALLEEEDSYENNTFKETLNKSFNFIPKQTLITNNKLTTLQTNDFLNYNVSLNNDNNIYNKINGGEIFTNNYCQHNLGWNQQMSNNEMNGINLQTRNLQNIYYNLNIPQIKEDKIQISYDIKQPIINVQQNLFFNYYNNYINDNIHKDDNSISVNRNIDNQISSTNLNSIAGTENGKECTNDIQNRKKENNNIIEKNSILNEDALNQSDNNRQSHSKTNKKTKNNKKRKCKKHKNQNDKSSNHKSDSNEYIIELFGKFGWICSKCNNFNYETRNKCNRCGIPKKPKKVSDIIKKKKDHSNNTSKETLLNNNKTKSKKGDWFCPNCNNLNFGFRQTCNICQLHREESFKHKNEESIEHNKKSVNNTITDSKLVFD